ncbi:GFA family protein [Paraneptunicella aestuarii]|uniref:GFA family protein n=1 Tax=Paraneptunicella aestuarii TaxID=2831148 RepID=UPI001E2BDF1C|nr:GFA family protein [Paraneptunicella aestuarii]UAA39319.1 GFA family protein [Paraneptunicella aestuarii]
MFKASCQCKAVQFQIEGKLTSPFYCHCETCRKTAGTVPMAWAVAKISDIKNLQQGEVGKYPSGKGLRCFCQQCGSPVWYESHENDKIWGIPLGVLDSGNIPAPKKHIWMSSNPDWCEVNDQLPKYPENA